MAENWQLKAVLSANSSGMIKALTGVSKQAQNTRKYLSDVVKSAGHLGGKLALPAGLGAGLLAGLTVAGVKNAMVGLADLEDEVSKLKATTGIAGHEFKKFQYLAQVSNVPFEALTGSVGKLNKNIYDAATGKNKDLASLLKRLGINTRDANGQFRSAIDMLPALADAFKRNQNPVVRARMGMVLFGKSWQEIMPLLAEGSDKINERMARFKELGLEVKDINAFNAQIDAAGELGDRIDDLTFVTGSLKNTIATKLLPVVMPMLNSMIKWAVTNKDVISSELTKFVQGIAKAIDNTNWNGIIAGAKEFAEKLGTVVNWLGGTKNALLALVVVMNAQTIVSLASMTASIIKASIAFLSMSASAYIAANAGLLSMLSMLRAAVVFTFVAGPVNALSAAMNLLGLSSVAAGGLMTGAMNMAMLAVRGLGAALLANPLGIILAIATGALLIWKNWGTLKTWFKEFFSWIGDKFEGVVGWVKDVAGAVSGIFSADNFQPPSMSVAAPAGAAGAPSLITPQQVRASGQIDININGAPPGTRVEQIKKTGDVPIRTEVGTRSYAQGSW